MISLKNNQNVYCHSGTVHYDFFLQLFFGSCNGYYTGDHSYVALRDHVHVSDNSSIFKTDPDPSGAENLNYVPESGSLQILGVFQYASFRLSPDAG